jgi:hypothetical protein
MYTLPKTNYQMPPFAFHCTFGALAYDQTLSLLVWLFEIPPSKINIHYRKVEVPVTPTTKNIYMNCIKHGSYKCTAPKVISSPFGIVLRKFVASPEYTPDQTAYNMLIAMSGGHHIEGEWNTSNNSWEMSTGLGYRNTGIRIPITADASEDTFRQPGAKTGLGYDIMFPLKRRRWEPIQFVPATRVVKVPEINDHQHAPWVATPPF